MLCLVIDAWQLHLAWNWVNGNDSHFTMLLLLLLLLFQVMYQKHKYNTALISCCWLVQTKLFHNLKTKLFHKLGGGILSNKNLFLAFHFVFCFFFSFLFVCADLLMHKDLSCGETGEKSHKVLVSLRNFLQNETKLTLNKCLKV